MSNVSTTRLYVLRAVYLLNFVGLSIMAWPAVVAPERPLGVMNGVAFSFWAALGTLMGLGVRYPLQMLPLLFIQLLYKIVWLLAVALPTWSDGRWNAEMTETTRAFVIPVVIDALIIPWRYVVANYLKKSGDISTLHGVNAHASER